MMRSVIPVASVLVAVTFLPAWATIINIPDDYTTIQGGIDASTDGDTVLVQPGTYVENIDFNGHNTVLGSLFLTTGDTSYISRTVIDGNESGSVVMFESGEDNSAVIAGFLIKNGRGGNGGGICCTCNSNPTIINNFIRNNTATYGFPELDGGGGIYCSESDPLILSNTISGNLAGSGAGGGILCDSCCNPAIVNNSIIQNSCLIGGGIYLYWSESTIMDNIIEGNMSITASGGIDCFESSPIIATNILDGNSTNSSGGGISCRWHSNPIINNNKISRNSAGSNGGGVYCDSSSNPTIINNAIIGNSAGVRAGGLYCHGSCDPIIINTIFWSNSAPNSNEVLLDTSSTITIMYSNIQDTLWPGEGNVSIDPLFRDPENGDFHLMATGCSDPYDSPCIDAGHPEILDSLLNCSWGLGEMRSDMGVYGGGDSVQVGIEDQGPIVPGRLAVMQNYPNPFNGITCLSYNLPVASDVTIEIYDILGRKVETLDQRQRPAGYHQIIWDAAGQSSGIYFYRIQAGDYAETRKMVLLK